MPVPFQIEVSSDRILRGDLFACEGKAVGTLIIAHGFKGFKDWGFFPYAAEQLSEFMDVVTFNFSHNGVGSDLMGFTELEKFAVNTYSLEQEDLAILVDAVSKGELPLEQQPSAQRLYLLGHSKGGGGSLIYAFDHPGRLNGVISWNGITDVDLFSPETKAEMRAKGRSMVPNARTKQEMPLDACILEDMEAHRERFAIVERSKRAELPIALIQGSEDSAKSRAGSAAMAAGNPRIRWIQIPGGNHTFGAVHPFRGTTNALEAAIRETKRFLRETFR
jgi:pimeloyl-ACP methyl ester carboxylesterase